MNSATRIAVKRQLTSLKARGFDKSFASTNGYVSVRCSRCEAMVINGVACHESRCPNIRRKNGEQDD
jgi:hypothetical protein